MVSVDLSAVSSKENNMTTKQSAKEASLRELIFDKASNTGMHGVPNMQRASSWFRKIFWLILVLGGLYSLQATGSVSPIASAESHCLQAPTEDHYQWRYGEQDQCRFGKGTDIPSSELLLAENRRAQVAMHPAGIPPTAIYLYSSCPQQQLATQQAVMLWQISLAVIKYRTHPTDTTIWYNTTTQMDFPAVTVCNLNPVRLSALHENAYLADLKDMMDEEWKEWGEQEIGANQTRPDSWQGQDFELDFDDEYDDPPILTKRKTRQADNKDKDEEDEDEEDEGEEDENFSFSSDVLTLISELKRDERLKVGHNLTTMLIGCTFRGRKCKSRDFKRFSNYLYGNCYTFNAGGINQTVKKINKVGPMYGLSLELYVEQEEYVKGVADAAGIRIVVHNQTYMPFPEDDGISISPGSKTTIGLRKLIKQRSIPPWGQCEDFTPSQNEHKNSFLFEMDHIEYSTQACLKTCYQKHLIKECDCYDPNFPYDRNNKIKAFAEYANDTFPACTKSTIKANKHGCVKAIEEKFINNTLGCQEECPVMCHESSYPYAASYATWPADVNSDRLLEEVAHTNEHFWDIMEGMDWEPKKMNSFIGKNFVKVEVYFGDLTSEHIIVKPSYLALDLISDLGGQAGLWVGVSMIALFELIELILDICVVVMHRFGEKRKPKPLEEDLTESTQFGKSAHMMTNTDEERAGTAVKA